MKNDFLLKTLKEAALRADLDDIRQLVCWDETNVLGSYEDIIVDSIADIMEGSLHQTEADRQKIYFEVFPIMEQKFRGAKPHSRHYQSFLYFLAKTPLSNFANISQGLTQDIMSNKKNLFTALKNDNLYLFDFPLISKSLKEDLVHDKKFLSACLQYNNYLLFQQLLTDQQVKITELQFFEEVFSHYPRPPAELLQDILNENPLFLLEHLNFIKSVINNEYATDTDLLPLCLKTISTNLYEETTHRKELLDHILLSGNARAFQLLLKAEPRYGLFLINSFEYGEYQEIEDTYFFIEARTHAQILNDNRLLNEKFKPLGTEGTKKRTHKI